MDRLIDSPLLTSDAYLCFFTFVLCCTGAHYTLSYHTIFLLKQELPDYFLIPWFYEKFFMLGKMSFNRRCLHDIGSTPNPYEQAISIIGRTLSAFDEDNLIPCFGFGDGNYLALFFCWSLDGFSITCLKHIADLELLFSDEQHQLMIRRYSAFTQRTVHATVLKRR